MAIFIPLNISSACSGLHEDQIDFVSFAREWCEDHHYIRGYKNYLSAVNALCRYFDRDSIMVSEITAKTMTGFEQSLRDRPRAQSLYTFSIVKLFNEARFRFNDEDRQICFIQHDLSKYHPPRQRRSKKRSLPEQTIRAIFELPYNNQLVRGRVSRHDLAKDCFMLSFALMGMNSADLYTATNYNDGNITYQRTKTKDRRDDRAEIQIRVPDIVLPLMEKYHGTDKVFSFADRYSCMHDFNRAINIGLKEIGEEIGVASLQFYAARHSMATIAVNKVGIDKYTVNDMLNHVEPSMRITDLYIEKDFTQINIANDRLMKYMFERK